MTPLTRINVEKVWVISLLFTTMLLPGGCDPRRETKEYATENASALDTSTSQGSAGTFATPAGGQGAAWSETLKSQFESAKNVCLSIKSYDDASGLGLFRDVTLAKPEGGPLGVILRATGKNPITILPDMDFPTGSRLIFRIDITSPNVTTLTIYYMTRSAPKYAEERKVMYFLRKGQNVFYLKLPAGNVINRVRFDPGIGAGDYILRSLEARSVAN